jgi:hypothetical protein
MESRRLDIDDGPTGTCLLGWPAPVTAGG